MFLGENDMLMHTLICKNAYMIRELLVIDMNKAGYLQENPREYYISTAIDEILRLMTSIIRWEDDFKDGFDKEKSETLIGNLIIQGFYSEINLYHRKFIEILTNILLWKDLNDDNYIKYYFLIKGINEVKNNIKDLKDFYEISSSIEQKKLDNIKDLIIQIYDNIDEDKCFFINKDNTYLTNINGKRYNLNESSYRYKLKKVLLKCGEFDKRLLGFTYNHYSQISDKIHFSNKNNRISPEVLGTTIRFDFIVINRIISVCAEMLGISGLKQIEQVNKMLEKLKYTIGWYTPLIHDIYDVDDYVYTIDGKLGRITNKIVSKYGYRSYEIYFLDDNGEGLVIDNFPAQEFKRIQSKQSLYNSCFEIHPEFKKIYEQEKDEKRLKESLDFAMKMLWKLELKERCLKKLD